MDKTRNILEQAIADCEVLAKSPLLSSKTRNSSQGVVNRHKSQFTKDVADEKYVIACIEDLYSEASLIRARNPDIYEKNKPIYQRLEEARDFVFKTTGQFNLRKADGDTETSLDIEI